MRMLYPNGARLPPTRATPRNEVVCFVVPFRTNRAVFRVDGDAKCLSETARHPVTQLARMRHDGCRYGLRLARAAAANEGQHFAVRTSTDIVELV